LTSLVSKRFVEVDAAIDHFVAQSCVRLQRHLVVEPGVRRHLNAAFAAGPIFRGGDELRADAPAAVVFEDESASMNPTGWRVTHPSGW
jgi:hypothetical protein